MRVTFQVKQIDMEEIESKDKKVLVDDSSVKDAKQVKAKEIKNLDSDNGKKDL